MEVIRHGEVLLIPIKNISTGKGKKTRELVVAHSETGHHHVAVGEITDYPAFDVSEIRKALTKSLYPDAEITGLFRVNSDSAELRHYKTFDKHETKPLVKGLYVRTIKRQFDYFTKMIERVRD